MRHLLALSFILLPLAPAWAQATIGQPFSPISGPNTPVPSPVCDLINFGFCPQPPPPAPPLPDPDPEADAAPPPRVVPAPLPVRHHYRRHRTYARREG